LWSFVSIRVIRDLNWETAIWIAIFVVSVILRLWMLGVRAMSHDESLHALYSYYLYANGNYDHNPMMHGPFLYPRQRVHLLPLWRQRLHGAHRPGGLWHGRCSG
jgi:predicted membrane-bound mannosyltransferase